MCLPRQEGDHGPLRYHTASDALMMQKGVNAVAAMQTTMITMAAHRRQRCLRQRRRASASAMRPSKRAQRRRLPSGSEATPPLRLSFEFGRQKSGSKKTGGGVVVVSAAPWRWVASNSGEKRPILCVTEEYTKNAIPISKRGLPELVWVGICQYSKSGSPRISLGFVPIWGPTYLCRICNTPPHMTES